METITLQYDGNNAQAQSIITMLRNIGLFKVCEKSKSASTDLTEEQEKEAFLLTSKVNASKIFAQYL